ncbi:MAG: LruC domain-containing protein [Bacteroidales bacterium]
MGIIKRVLLLLIFSSFLNACVKPPKSIADDDSKEYFDFKTIGDYAVTIDYKLKYNTPIVFYIYDEYPFQKTGTDPEVEYFNELLKPVLKGITENFGKYSGIISIKKAVNQLYLYSPTIGVPQLLKSTFSNNSFSIDATNPLNHIVSLSISPDRNSPFAQNAIIAGGFHTLGSWSSNGVPDYLKNPSITLSAGFINDINATLPENKKVPELNPQFISSGENSSIHIVAEAKVEMVFIHEGASMKNVLGYFHYPTNSPPKNVSEITHMIAFPNASYSGSGGGLSPGDRVQLKYWNGSTYSETFPPGVSIGWYIIAYGFRGDASISVKGPNYYSFEEFNPETDPLLKSHNVQIFDSERMVVLVGFEDQNRAKSDQDFNDALFYAAATPESAIQYAGIPTLKKSNDSDSDGIPDDRDEFPDDASVVYSTHYPAINSYNTLAFEDLWPNRGDYDMNDVVVSYNSTHYLNKSNQIVKIIDRIRPVWSGGILDVGFGFQLGVPASSVKTVTKSGDFVDNNFRYTLSANGTETKQNKATIMAFDNITEMSLTAGGAKPTINFEVAFNSPVNISDLTTPPYNPFIVINKNRGMEVHMPNYPPTDRADYTLYGTYDDKSKPSLHRFYVSDSEMPWGILIPGEFNFPTERVSIVNFYPKFLKWAESFGSEFPDWYLYPLNK